MKYPEMENLKKIAATAGGNPPDPISGAKVFDAIHWNVDTGEIWDSPILASDVNNIIIWRKNIYRLAFVGTGKITADEIISRIASYSCPALQSDTPHCAANAYGFPVCDKMPLCKHAQAVKAEISRKEGSEENDSI